MNGADALNAAIRALQQIDTAVDNAQADAEDILSAIRDIVSDTLGELARDGYVERTP